MDPENRIYWIYDVFGPQLPEATANGLALELAGRVFLAHTRALIWTHFNERIRAYGHGARTCRPPLLACHGHTHVPCVTQFAPPFNRLLYINEPASALLRAENFVPHRATTLELIRQLARENEAQVRQILRRVSIEGATVTMPVRSTLYEDRRFLLRLFPLPARAGGAGPVDHHGIRLEAH